MVTRSCETDFQTQARGSDRDPHLIVTAGGDHDAVPNVSERPERSLPPLVAGIGARAGAETLLNDVHISAGLHTAVLSATTMSWTPGVSARQYGVMIVTNIKTGWT